MALPTFPSTLNHSPMPLLSQPWANPTSESSRVVALRDTLPAGVAQSMVQGIFFLGPFLLGALFWEAASGVPTDLKVASQYVKARQQQEPRNGWLVGTRLLASLARITAIIFLAIYISYTHGAIHIACGGWPRAMVAVSALALSFSVFCFVLKAIGVARLSRPALGLLATLSFAQFLLPLIAIHSWSGALTPSQSACYLRIKT